MSMLPPGTFAALKKSPNEAVILAIVTVVVGGIAAGAPAWPIVAVAALAFRAHHVRSTAAERHKEVMAQRRIDETVEQANALKAEHRLRTLPNQPDLPLERGQPRLTGRRRDNKDKAP